MQVSGAVDADAHQPAFVVQEPTPLGREQKAVGLYAVADALAPTVVLLQPYDLTVEVEGPQHRFAAMPGEEHVGRLLQLYVIADVVLPDPL